MLKAFGFRGKMLYLCIAKRRTPINKGFSPLFSCEKAKITKHIEKFTCLRKIFICFSGKFSRQVGARNDDIGNRNVKRYLFFEGAFLTFRATTQVDFH